MPVCRCPRLCRAVPVAGSTAVTQFVSSGPHPRIFLPKAEARVGSPWPLQLPLCLGAPLTPGAGERLSGWESPRKERPQS